MKKIMIALGAVAMVAGVQAATVTWGSGAIYLPTLATATTYMKAGSSTSSGATYDGKPMSSVSKYVAAYVWEYVAGDKDWAAFNTGTKDIWASFDADTGDLNGLAASATGGTAGSGQTTLAGTKSYGESDKAYAVILYTWDYNKDGDADYYIAKTVETDAVGTGKSVGSLAGTTNTNTSAWTAVPEPTSGLLLLVGMCGLALRRRRA